MPSTVILRRIVHRRPTGIDGGSRTSLCGVVAVQDLLHIVDVHGAPPAR